MSNLTINKKRIIKRANEWFLPNYKEADKAATDKFYDINIHINLYLKEHGKGQKIGDPCKYMGIKEESNNCVGIPSGNTVTKLDHGSDEKTLREKWLVPINTAYTQEKEGDQNLKIKLMSIPSPLKELKSWPRYELIETLLLGAFICNPNWENLLVFGHHNNLRAGYLNIELNKKLYALMNAACFKIVLKPSDKDNTWSAGIDLIYDGEPDMKDGTANPKYEYIVANDNDPKWTNLNKNKPKKFISSEFSDIEKKWTYIANLVLGSMMKKIHAITNRPSLIKPKTIYFFRHGEAPHNIQDDRCKHKFVDNFITHTGIKQAQTCGKNIYKHLIHCTTYDTVIMASPLTRTIDTGLNVLLGASDEYMEQKNKGVDMKAVKPGDTWAHNLLENNKYLKQYCKKRKEFNEQRDDVDKWLKNKHDPLSNICKTKVFE